jgi:hypothetical protein
MRTGFRARAATAAVAGLVCAAASLVVAGESAGQDRPARAARGVQRAYRGPGLASFRIGHRAWELGDWKTAAARMAEASERDLDQPEAQVRIPGVFHCPYVPRYYRSLALCNLRECREARRDMDDVLRLIKDAPGHLRRRYQNECQKVCPATAP